MTKQEFMQKQTLPYAAKVNHAEQRAREFYETVDNCHVSVGGLDSITLLLFLKSIGINVPAISVSQLEDKSIQAIHDQLGIIKLKPIKSKAKVLQEEGFPVISKQVAGKIHLLQNPTEKNKTVRNAIITGDCGKQGGYRKGTRMRLPQKWLNLFGGPENEKYGTNYHFDRLREDNPKEWYYWMYEVGWGEVLDYIGVGWEDVVSEKDLRN